MESSGIHDLVIGLAIFGIGLAVTLYSYHLAATSPSGGSYIFAWGAIVFGAFQALKGVIGILSGD